MSGRERILLILALLFLTGIAKVGQQLYRWRAFTAEREMIGRLEVELETAAIGVITTQMLADTLRRALDASDAELDRAHGKLNNLEGRRSFAGPGSAAASSYRQELRRYNQKVARRNDIVDEWRGVVRHNHMHVDRYNAVADSIRDIASRMGEEFYPIRTPAEIAVARGLLPGEG